MTREHPFLTRAQLESDRLYREHEMGPWMLQHDGYAVRVIAEFLPNDTWYQIQRRNRDGSFSAVGTATQDSQAAGQSAQHHASVSGLLHRVVEFVSPPKQEGPKS